MTRRLFISLLALLYVVTISRAQETNTLTVFAASSLTDAFEQIAERFKADHPNTNILFNFASSSDLAAQLSEGAPTDIFASANAKQMTVAQDAKRIAGKPVTFAKNRLVLIVPADNPAQIAALHDLSNAGIKLVIAAKDVPVRTYTDTMLDRLAADAAYGEAYRTAFTTNVVSEEQNVRQVASKVALGEADAGIVYVSDVTADIQDQVKTIAIPDYLNTIATYPIATINDAAAPDLAQAFIDYVLSDAGQDILVANHFISIRIADVPATITLPTDTNAVVIEGQILNPLTLTVDDLKASFSAQTIDATYKSGQDSVTATYTGVPLWQIISAAQPNLNADVKNDKLSLFIVVTGSDGYQAVIAWGEIDPDFADKPILLAYEQDGAAISNTGGPLRLVVPGDGHGGRYVGGVVNISLRDAPRVGE